MDEAQERAAEEAEAREGADEERCPAMQIAMRLNIHNKIFIAYMIFSNEKLFVTSVGRDRNYTDHGWLI